MEKPPKSNPPNWLLEMSNNRIVNYFLCFVPDAKVNILSKGLNRITNYCKFQEYNNLTKSTDSWKIISRTIDRIYLLVVAIFLVYIAIRGY